MNFIYVLLSTFIVTQGKIYRLASWLHIRVHNPSDTDEFFVGAPKRPRINKKPTFQLKCDKIQIQTFSGKSTEWIAFRDQFIDLVHMNPNLTEITKFYQLQTHLTGDALDVLNGFKMSSVDYDPAWQALKQRYDNKRNLIFEYIKQFIDLPNLPPHADKSKFLAMVDKTNQMLRVLPRFKD